MSSQNDDQLKSFLYNIIVLSGVSLGVGVRLLHLFRIPPGVPFRLGGLFYEFSQQILANGYRLPKNIPFYSQGGIPFAYPPLGFYVQAFIIDVFAPDRFWTVNVLPPLVASLGVLSYYFLLRKITNSRKVIIGALFAYALMPAAFTNQIEAAGLAEAFGTLALIWYAFFLISLEKRQRAFDVFGAGLLLGLSVVASPGSALGGVTFSLLYAGKVLINRQYKLLRKFIMVGVIAFIISAPYWGNVIINHGVKIFSLPVSGQFNSVEGSSFIARFLQSFFEFNYAGGDYAFIWNVLILIGLLWYFFKEKWFIPILFFTLALIPREGVWITALVSPLLVGVALADFALPLFEKGLAQISKKNLRLSLFTFIVLAFISSLIINTILAIEEQINDDDWKISAVQIDEIEKLREEIPPDAQILVIGNEALLEWTPQIIRREVINTHYGLEWQPDEYVTIIKINETIEEAQSWDDIFAVLRDNVDVENVYILSDKDYLFRLEKGDVNLIDVTETSLFRVERFSK